MQYRHDYEKREAYTRCRMEKWEAFCIRNARNFFLSLLLFLLLCIVSSCCLDVQKLKKEFYKCISFKIFNRSSSIGFVKAFYTDSIIYFRIFYLHTYLESGEKKNSLTIFFLKWKKIGGKSAIWRSRTVNRKFQNK